MPDTRRGFSNTHVHLQGQPSNQRGQGRGDAPVADDEYSKIELEHGGEEGEGHRPGSDGEEVPQHLGDHGLVGHGQLVITGVAQDLLVGGNHPGQGHQRRRG